MAVLPELTPEPLSTTNHIHEGSSPDGERREVSGVDATLIDVEISIG